MLELRNQASVNENILSGPWDFLTMERGGLDEEEDEDKKNEV